MRYVFVLNPRAGFVDSTPRVASLVRNAFQSRDAPYEIYRTRERHDARRHVERICGSVQEEVRFYAGGGDGTLNEVLNGMIHCPRASLGILPMGSCCDFIKTFGDYDYFDIRAQIEGETRPVDVIRVNDRYAINVANIGFDANVVETAVAFRRRLPAGKAYKLSILYNALFRYRRRGALSVDGEEVHNGPYLLAAFANGAVYGGGYRCAPEARMDDGLMDICLVRHINRTTFQRLISFYKQGLHLERPEVRQHLLYRQGRTARMVSDRWMNAALDGELCRWKEAEIELLEKKVRVILPRRKTSLPPEG